MEIPNTLPLAFRERIEKLTRKRKKPKKKKKKKKKKKG